MAIIIATAKDRQVAKSKIKFCYLCGRLLSANETNRDHVPPQSAFAEPDRVDPLILRTHIECNQSWSVADESMGDLFSGLTGRELSHNSRLRLVKIPNPVTGEEYSVITGIDLKQIVQRCIRAFHAILYSEYLPVNTLNSISMQFPSISSHPDGDSNWESLHPMHPMVSRRLWIENRSNNCDMVTAYNGKCEYLCNWDKLDNGISCCLFALRIHEWEKLADSRLVPECCTVGIYVPPKGRPPTAARSRCLEAAIKPKDYLNPFE